MNDGDTVVLVHNATDDRGDDHVSATVRALGFRIERVFARHAPPPAPAPRHAGAVVFGGAESVNDAGRLEWLGREVDWTRRWLDSGRPFLGVCLGSQLLGHALGARVGRHPEGIEEIGYREIRPTAAAGNLIERPLGVYQWHNEGIFEPVAQMEVLASGDPFPVQAYRAGTDVYGVQFHPEVTEAVLRRWLPMQEEEGLVARPDVPDAERQWRDESRHGAAMRAWLGRFLTRWLGAAGR